MIRLSVFRSFSDLFLSFQILRPTKIYSRQIQHNPILQHFIAVYCSSSRVVSKETRLFIQNNICIIYF